MEEQTQEQNNLGTEEEKPKRRVISSVIIFALCAIFAFGAFAFIWYLMGDFSDFDDFSSEAYIECLGDGAEPQSVAVYKPSSGSYSGERCYIVGANAKTGEAGLYISGDTSGYIGYVPLTFEGEAFCGNVLVATNGYAVWVASGDTVYVTASSSRSNCNNLVAAAASNAEVLRAQSGETEDETEEGEKAEIGEIESYDLQNSFCTYMDIGFISAYGTTRLYIGENNTESFKKSDHAAKTPAGDKNTAFVYEYITDTSDKTYGLSFVTGYDDEEKTEKTVPKVNAVYSVPGNVNGWARTIDGALVLSQGSTLASSHILVYNWSEVSSTSSSNRKYYKDVMGENYIYKGLYRESGAKYTDSSLRVYYVESSKLTDDLTVPPLVAGISAEASSGNVHILFASGYGANATLARKVERSIYGFAPAI